MKVILRRYLRSTFYLLLLFPLSFFTEWWRFISDYRKLKAMNPYLFGFKITPKYPCLTDRKTFSGSFGKYIYQDSWAFKHLLAFRPKSLVDIGSTTYYVAFVAQVTKVISIDIRPNKSSMENLETKVGDVTNIPFPDQSVEAISSLSVIEHVGLGRYGDELDIEGMQKAINEFKRILKKSGMLLVAFPVGSTNEIVFNGHRICTPEKVFEMFDGLDLVEEIYALSDKMVNRKTYDNLKRPYAYGCYRFTK
jgi:SAM-dependent methyltransferase